jgi:hypothetical protein
MYKLGRYIGTYLICTYLKNSRRDRPSLFFISLPTYFCSDSNFDVHNRSFFYLPVFSRGRAEYNIQMNITFVLSFIYTISITPTLPFTALPSSIELNLLCSILQNELVRFDKKEFPVLYFNICSPLKLGYVQNGVSLYCLTKI